MTITDDKYLTWHWAVTTMVKMDSSTASSYIKLHRDKNFVAMFGPLQIDLPASVLNIPELI